MLDGTVIGRNVQRRTVEARVPVQMAIHAIVDPKPFVRAANSKRALAAVKRGKEKLESIH